MLDDFESQLQALGKVVVEFTALERVLSSCVAELTNDDQPIGVMVTSRLSYRNKLDALRALAEYQFGDDPDLMSEIDGLNNDARRAGDQRNEMLHGAHVFRNSCETPWCNRREPTKVRRPDIEVKAGVSPRAPGRGAARRRRTTPGKDNVFEPVDDARDTFQHDRWVVESAFRCIS